MLDAFIEPTTRPIQEQQLCDHCDGGLTCPLVDAIETEEFVIDTLEHIRSS